MATYEYTGPMVNNVLSQLGDINTQIRNILNGVEQEVGASLREWTSDARTAYEGRRSEWNAAAAQMPVSLQAAGTALGDIQNTIRRAESEGQAIFGR
ncbi:WXG100 family type VII secretion target [Lentzea sp. NPDC058436]|uniref:WXG100 family type VII secretion target n=1 Tax=Lentzea sp. NPDC058436 TaxID=3346499 RepID=UPI00364D634E